MVNYYTFVDDIYPGHLSESEDVNSIQNSVAVALSQLVIDGFGRAFVLDPSEFAFELVGADYIVDQKNLNGNAWKSLSQLFISQDIDLQKSSIVSIQLQFKNETETAKNIVIHLQNIITEYSGGNPYLSTYTLSVTPGTGTYTIPFNLHHLPCIPTTLLIERVEGENVYVLYDEEANYSSGMAESDNQDEYEKIGADLWFAVIYGNERTYNIDRSMTVINGEKVLPNDTHITLSAGSRYGNRYDVVCLTDQGIYVSIEGTPALLAQPPYNIIPQDFLRLATIYVPRNSTSRLSFEINQEDALGQHRIRSHHERIRRLEKMAYWMKSNDPPRRVKYTLDAVEFFDEENSSDNITLPDGSTEPPGSIPTTANRYPVITDPTRLKLPPSSNTVIRYVSIGSSKEEFTSVKYLPYYPTPLSEGGLIYPTITKKTMVSERQYGIHFNETPAFKITSTPEELATVKKYTKLAQISTTWPIFNGLPSDLNTKDIDYINLCLNQLSAGFKLSGGTI